MFGLLVGCFNSLHFDAQAAVRFFYESWVVPAGVPSALAAIGGRVEANY